MTNDLVRVMVSYAGVDGSVVVGKLLEKNKPSQGFDAQNEETEEKKPFSNYSSPVISSSNNSGKKEIISDKQCINFNLGNQLIINSYTCDKLMFCLTFISFD